MCNTQERRLLSTHFSTCFPEKDNQEPDPNRKASQQYLATPALLISNKPLLNPLSLNADDPHPRSPATLQCVSYSVNALDPLTWHRPWALLRNRHSSTNYVRTAPKPTPMPRGPHGVDSSLLAYSRAPIWPTLSLVMTNSGVSLRMATKGGRPLRMRKPSSREPAWMRGSSLGVMPPAMYTPPGGRVQGAMGRGRGDGEGPVGRAGCRGLAGGGGVVWESRARGVAAGVWGGDVGKGWGCGRG